MAIVNPKHGGHSFWPRVFPKFGCVYHERPLNADAIDDLLSALEDAIPYVGTNNPQLASQARAAIKKARGCGMIIIEDINGVRYTLNPEHVVIADTGAKAKRQGRVCSVHCRDYPQAIEITRAQADAIERHWNAADIRERQITPADCMADLELVERLR